MAKKSTRRKGGLPKKYIKKYGVTKAAWKAYRRGALKGTATTAAGRKKKRRVKRKTAKKRTTAKKTVIKSIKIGGKTTMAKRKYRRRKRRAPRRYGARRMRLITGKTTKAIMNGGVIGGTAVLSTFILNKVPWVKDQSGWIKAAVQAGAGVLLLGMAKNEWVKKFGAGAITGGAISLIVPFMPEGFKFAGGRKFTEEELLELQTMGIPIDIAEEAAAMGLPIDIAGKTAEHRPKMQANYNY